MLERSYYLQQIKLGKLDFNMQKNYTGPLFSLILYKTQSQWVKHLNVRPDILKLPEDEVERCFNV